MRIFSATAFAAVVLCLFTVVQSTVAFAEDLGSLRARAESGEAEAQLKLGDMYSYGDGVDKDMREAVHWYRKAAKQGDHYGYGNLRSLAAIQGVAEAQFAIGELAKDTREAVHWFHKAAEQGHANAQAHLGEAYYEGDGVAKDAREAVHWYRKAAEQGHAGAQNNLGSAYWDGEGVITDEREAYIWVSIAKANGSETAAENFDKVPWSNFLSQSEIRSAKKEAARRLEEIDRRKAGQGGGANFTLAPEPKGENSAARVFENTWRSVVVVHNGDTQGSGVIVRPNVVATNCHVVDSRARIIVHKSAARRADTETDFSAEILRADRKKDFCLLKVQNLWGVVATVRKYDTLKIGEKVYALGAPQGLDLSLSEGVISQLRKSRSARFIQTDAAISPGSSGGGLFDRDGNLIGILTSKITGQNTEGLGFAIPADLVLGN